MIVWTIIVCVWLTGQFLGETGRSKESADNYVRAAMLSPDDFELVFNAANALRQAAQHSEAEEFYRKAARISPKVSDCHEALQFIYWWLFGNFVQ